MGKWSYNIFAGKQQEQMLLSMYFFFKAYYELILF